MNICFYSAKSYEKDFFNRLNQGNKIHYVEASLNESTVELTKGHECVCVFVNDKLNSDIIEKLAANGVKLIALRCAGYNNVDLNSAKEYGLKVVRVPAYSPHAVAEHTLALILTLNRKTHKAYNRVRDGNFSLENLMGFDIYKKTVGVIGTGKIGQTFCRIMLGLGCKVIAYDLIENDELKQQGVNFLPLNRLLETSDIISLHCPLNDNTHHLINAQTLNLIKKGAMLINTGRGALIDTKAVIRALKNGQLGYLGIDVYEQEDKLFFKDLSAEIIQDDTLLRLLTFPNVIITSHQAFFTQEAMTEITLTTLNNIKSFEEGKDLINCV